MVYLLLWQDEFLAGKRIRKRKRVRLVPDTVPDREVKKIAAEFFLEPLVVKRYQVYSGVKEADDFMKSNWTGNGSGDVESKAINLSCRVS